MTPHPAESAASPDEAFPHSEAAPGSASGRQRFMLEVAGVVKALSRGYPHLVPRHRSHFNTRPNTATLDDVRKAGGGRPAKEDFMNTCLPRVCLCILANPGIWQAYRKLALKYHPEPRLASVCSFLGNHSNGRTSA